MSSLPRKLDELIRDVGDYTEVQMKDLLNQKASTGGSALRMAFRFATTGKSVMKKACEEAGIQFEGWLTSLNKLVEIAEKTGSTAADKIKKAIPVATQLTAEFEAQPGGVLKKIKIAKLKNIQY
ncbi:MAG: hypothetical protein HY052_03195 [Proteobacteria bacterium]|nr:hypothetical protein [Pseudomonadota bacterium]